jgi:hypothetical protein
MTKKIVLISVDETQLKNATGSSENYNTDELILLEMGWVAQSGILVEEVIDYPEDGEDNDKKLPNSESSLLRHNLVVDIIKQIKEDLEYCENNILWDLIACIPSQKLIEYLPEDMRIMTKIFNIK